MRKRKNGRVYLKSGRYYGDFRDLGGKLEALIPQGEKRATQDHDIAADLANARVKVLEAKRRGKHLPTPQHDCAGGCGRQIGIHVERCWRCRTRTVEKDQ